MKLNAIKRVCKRDGEYVIFNDNGNQWLGTSNAGYEVKDVYLKRESIGSLLDVDMSKSGVDVREEQLEFSALCPREDDVPVDLQVLIGIYSNGDIYRIFSDGERIYIVNEVFIKPVFHQNSGYITFKATENKTGDALILIGDGMLTTAVIRPESKDTTETIIDAMKNIARIYDKEKMEENA